MQWGTGGACDPGVADCELVEAQQIHDADLCKYSPKQVRPLRTQQQGEPSAATSRYDLRLKTHLCLKHLHGDCTCMEHCVMWQSRAANLGIA